jgi:hypothetical protein
MKESDLTGILPISGVSRGSSYHESVRTSTQNKRPTTDFKSIEMEDYHTANHHDHWVNSEFEASREFLGVMTEENGRKNQ